MYRNSTAEDGNPIKRFIYGTAEDGNQINKLGDNTAEVGNLMNRFIYGIAEDGTPINKFKDNTAEVGNPINKYLDCITENKNAVSGFRNGIEQIIVRLPKSYTQTIGQIHFVAGLYIEGFIKLRYIWEWSVNAEFCRRVNIGQYTICQFFLTNCV